MAAVDRTVQVARAMARTRGHQLGPFDRRTTPWWAICKLCGGQVVVRTYRSAYGLSAFTEGCETTCTGEAPCGSP